jgi:hypothetical protein
MDFIGFEDSNRYYQKNITTYPANTYIEYYVKLTVTITMVGEPPAQWDEYAFSENYNYTIMGSELPPIDPIRYLLILYLEYPSDMSTEFLYRVFVTGLVIAIVISIVLVSYKLLRKNKPLVLIKIR